MVTFFKRSTHRIIDISRYGKFLHNGPRSMLISPVRGVKLELRCGYLKPFDNSGNLFYALTPVYPLPHPKA